ncbi:MAG: PQQ-binding-like beta-propeller repeat protein [Actinomycetota bacterium]|nr:PQQ-binding-like beta-propeller repeat protein [Actinomycetota bacterium]
MSSFTKHGMVFLLVLALLGTGLGLLTEVFSGESEPSTIDAGTDGNGATANTDDTGPLATDTTIPATTTSSSTTTTVAAPRTDVLVDPASFGTPYGTAVAGVLTFRGNPTRSYYGTGPVPQSQPQVLWRYPGSKMCGTSSEYGNVRSWCGTGWTGQPAVFERDGRTWAVFGAYDYKIHFVDAITGQDIIPPFETNDLAKGNVTIDPDGYPLVYAGSRDNHLRVIAFDGTEPRELFSIDARVGDRMHNDDWDAAPLVLNDHLIEGSENSWFYGLKLNRAYAADGTVTVDPQQVFRVQGWDDQLIKDLGSKDPKRVSLEASVSVSGDTAWLNSSGGLVQGWDISSLRTGGGEVTRTFRFWTGDDSDSSIVPDDEGFIYVGAEIDRMTSRSQEVGQMLKLDPRNPDNPIVWSVKTTFRADDGVWTTPIITGNVVIWTTKPGEIYGIDRTTGAVLWTQKINGPALSSPLLVDGVLIQGDGAGILHAYDVSNPSVQPSELWTVQLDGNIESTPVIWKGRIYVGTRGGYFVCIGTP